MIQIDDKSVHFATSQNLSEIQDEEWKIIAAQKHTFLLSNNCNVSYLRYPGFVFSNLEAKDCYLRIYNDFVNNGIFTPSRGNLSINNNYIFIGIRPGHVYAHLSQADTAWLFGPSSTLLHKLLIEKGIYPYFTNIYNEPDKPFNLDFSFILKELMVISYIYKVVYKMSELNLVFMGNYQEFPLFQKYLIEHETFKTFKMNVKFHSIWHPGYLARGYDNNKFESWKNQL